MTEQINPTGTVPEILIVEDSPVEAEMLRRILVRADYRVMLATNGKEGLQALREHPCALVISDINMPLMDGYQLCRAIKLDEKLWGTPVILVTMLSEPKDIIMALDVGAESYITKPYVEDNLLERISSLLSNPLHRKLAEERRRIQVEYGGKSHSVIAGDQQMANLLLSVYENSLILNRELMHIQNQLNVLNESLDEKVRERTAELQESEERYRQIIQTSMDGFWITDTGGRILDVNGTYCQLIGYAREELLNMRISDVEAKEKQEDTAQHIQEVMTKGHARFETRHRCKDGQLLDIEVSAVYRTEKEGGHLFIFLRDITERKQEGIRLNEQIKELRRWHEATLGLGMRNIELKREVNELLVQAGQPPRYSSVEMSAE